MASNYADMSNFQLLAVVGHGSETHIQVGEKHKHKLYVSSPPQQNNQDKFAAEHVKKLNY